MFSKYKKDEIMYYYTKLYGHEDNEHYSLEAIYNTDSQYNILLSERSNGKSYALKKYLLLKAYYFDREFVYVRRRDTDITTASVRDWLADMPIDEYTNGEYTTVVVYQGDIYFGYIDNDGKICRGKKMASTIPVNTYGKYKSRAYPKVDDIVYEEFITDSVYLYDEVTSFLNLVSTVARDRDIKVWLLGNKISQICPYIEEWSLTNALTQKPGSLDTYKFKSTVDGKETTTLITVENCTPRSHKSRMFFGKMAENIDGGKWEGEVKAMPRPSLDLEKYLNLYEVVIEEGSFHFVVQLLFNKETSGQILYVYPFTGNRVIRRHITTEFSESPWYSQRFKDYIPAEVTMRRLLLDNKVCYSHNLCGNNFQQMLMNRKGGF